ncbi:hypothetical protein ASPCADRAFT_170546 [Aspergillus carbonarius ITEM 5010]|uniref:Uncharacterized protein n=1 Tax=Aspergillus carbonarius (strain ITEM 5010) TaxID=602072 RepID=A0A1R3RJ71_ASPC5|nr:hypothetical protein ASPCADRAFT_170546 [Aspergillus carbonarius ITEM 5010]
MASLLISIKNWFQYQRVGGNKNLAQISSPAAVDHSSNVDCESLEFDRALTTRSLAVTGLLVSWVIGILCVVFGSGHVLRPTLSMASKNWNETGFSEDMHFHNWPQLNISSTAGELLPLLINTIVTLLMEAMGLIHSTTLRWALHDRLTFHSNLRIFTTSDQHGCLGKASNTLHAVFLIMAYAGASLMLATPPAENFCKTVVGLGDEQLNGCGDIVVLATPSLCCLGVGLLGQAALTTWQFFAIPIPTWSSNPLDTAWASVSGGSRVRVPGRCMMSVYDAELPTEPRQPQSRQRSLWKSHREARFVMSYIWLVTWIFLLIFIIIQVVLVEKDRLFSSPDSVGCNGCNAYLGSNWNLLRDSGNTSMSAAIIAEYYPDLYGGLWILFAILQGTLTLVLHCAELVISASRDEDTWRQCYTQHVGKNARPNALIRAATSWTAVLLFLFKVVLHWLFGNAISYAYNWGIFIRPPPLLYLTIGSFLLSSFVSFICFRRPRGEQPSTFGHVQTLVNLVDVWHLQLFWGDKGVPGSDGVRHAGTASKPLERVIMNEFYA